MGDRDKRERKRVKHVKVQRVPFFVAFRKVNVKMEKMMKWQGMQALFLATN